MNKFRGVIVPMISPVDSDMRIDSESVEKIVDSFTDWGCAPFVLGTTGEAASLSTTQKKDLVYATAQSLNKRSKLFVGISGTSLFDAIESTHLYKELEADIAVTTLPYYYPISQSEMIKFFEQLADQSALPIMLYNMPAMVGQSIPMGVAEKLSKHPNIIGMKDSERDMERINKSIESWKDRPDFAFYLGWAAQSAQAVLNGADGIVPSTANFVPELYQKLFEAAAMGNDAEAQQLQEITSELSLVYQKDRTLNSSLPALKVLMSAFGLTQVHAIPPMYAIDDEEQKKLKAELFGVMEKWGLRIEK